MNCLEFSNNLDIVYNNIMSNIAPPINEYEKSIFLTRAQEEIVAELIKQFEQSEQAREYLKPLIVTTKLTTPVVNTNKISETSITYELPLDIQHITLEKVKLTNVTSLVNVKVVSHDMYDHISDNPFKGPNNTRVLRIDGYENTPIAELITNGKIITYYFLKYIKNPYPIILEDLSVDYMGNTINGKHTPLSPTLSASELPVSLHYTIVDRAAQLAKIAYQGQLTNNQ